MEMHGSMESHKEIQFSVFSFSLKKTRVTERYGMTQGNSILYIFFLNFFLSRKD